jgi:RimJ/RimL family protein N-acetyltransferase
MLALREARKEDEARLLRWRNELSTREVSLNRAEIGAEEHHAWFVRRLSDPECRLLVIEESGRPVGQVRLDRTRPGIAFISISLAEGERGRGLGREALRLACNEADHALMVTELRALVRRENQASLRMLRTLGFRAVSQDDGVIELASAVNESARPCHIPT